jgi:hypothetical protein
VGISESRFDFGRLTLRTERSGTEASIGGQELCQNNESADCHKLSPRIRFTCRDLSTASWVFGLRVMELESKLLATCESALFAVEGDAANDE